MPRREILALPRGALGAAATAAIPVPRRAREGQARLAHTDREEAAPESHRPPSTAPMLTPSGMTQVTRPLMQPRFAEGMNS